MKRLSPREVRRAQERLLKNMGLAVEELGVAEEVVVKLPNKTMTIKGPSVYTLKTGGETVIQVVGGELAEAEAVEKQAYTPSEEDVMLVASQTGVSDEEARKALVEAGGDLAKAILGLRSRRQ
ncbi:MAG: nascent polypeptide-associated complex protein [Candidatus Caldarchaeum sp.]